MKVRMSVDSCQITKTKDTTDPLEVQQSEAGEAQDADEDQTGPQKDVSGDCDTAKKNQALRDQRGVLPTRTSCPPPRPQHPSMNQPKGISNQHPNLPDVNLRHVAKSTAESSHPQPLQPYMNQALCNQNGVLTTRTNCPPPLPQQANMNQATVIGNHPNTPGVNLRHASKLTAGSCLPLPPQPNTHGWSGAGNHLHRYGVYQNHQWNEAGCHTGLSQYPGHIPGRPNFHQPGILRAGPYPGHANLHQTGTLPTGPFPQPGILPTPAAHHQHGEASEQWPPGSGGSAPPPAWTPRKRKAEILVAEAKLM